MPVEEKKSDPQSELISRYEIEESSPSEGAVSAPDESAEPQPVAADAQGKAERPRDESGKFVKKDDKKFDHSPRLRRMAEDYGLSQDQIDSTSPEILDEVVFHLHQQHQKLLRDHSIQRTMEANSRKPQEAQQEPEPDDLDWGVSPEGTKYSESDYAKPVASTIKQVRDLMKEVKSLKEELSGMKQSAAQRQAAAMQDRLDRLFAAHANIFGSSPSASLAPGTKEGARRQAVMAHLNTLLSNKQSTTLEADFAKAASLLFGVEEPTKTGISKEEWQNAGLAAPTYRKSVEPLGARKALREVSAKIKEMNGAVQDESSELDGFLG